MPTQAVLPESFGRYRILKKLGEGGMGAVYLAEDALLGRQIALKVPHFSADDGPAVIERFYREAKVAAQLTHPDVCPVLDVGEVNGIHFLTMPFIEGQALSRYLGSDRPWAPARACALMRRLAVAVGVLHQRGMVHRDLKPGNVMVRPGGEPMLMDFGLARSFTSQSRRLTSTGAAMGTPAYMAPEQVLGESDSLGPATDLYALGVILFEMLTGHLPFEGPPMAVFGQILHAEPPLASSLLPGIDRRLDVLCRRAMAKKPHERFASAAAFADALEAFTVPVLVADTTPVATATLPVAVAIPARAAPTPPPPTSPTSNSFPCPQCRKSVRVPPEMTGRKVRCAHCGASLGVVPEVAGLPQPTQPLHPPTGQRETARLQEVTLADPPRRHSRPGRPTGGSSALLWLSIGGGVVVLLVVVLLVATGGGGLPSGWVKYRSGPGGWEAAFPREPKDLFMGEKLLSMEMIGVELDKGHTVVVMHSSVVALGRGATDQETLDRVVGQGKMDGVGIERERRFSVQGYPACELVGWEAGRRMKMRIIIANQNSFILSAPIEPGLFSEMEADTFLDSFRIVTPPLPPVEPFDGKFPLEGDFKPKS